MANKPKTPLRGTFTQSGKGGQKEALGGTIKKGSDLRASKVGNKGKMSGSY
jgi:hypothetical protein